MNHILRKISQAALTGSAAVFTTVTTVMAETAPDINIPAPTYGLTDPNIGGLIVTAVNIALIIAALLTFLFLIWGGIQWITSGGDKAAYEAARNRITAALVGLAIVAAAYIITRVITSFLNIPIFTGQ